MDSTGSAVSNAQDSILETTEGLPPELLELLSKIKDKIIDPTPEVLEKAARMVRRERAKRLGHAI